MRLIEKTDRYEIWAASEAWGIDYLVYGHYLNGDPRICPSLGMAREVAASL